MSQGNLFLCSHRFIEIDVFSSIKYILKNKIVKDDNRNITIVTSKHDLLFWHNKKFGDYTLYIIITEKENTKASDEIKKYLDKGFNVMIYYTKNNIRSGILKILNELQVIPKIYILRINSPNDTVNTYKDQMETKDIYKLRNKYIEVKNFLSNTDIIFTEWYFDIQYMNKQTFIVQLRNFLYN